ncbi:putative bcs1 AAA-type ATPase [Aspergillus flavus]|uniref:Bcs1 AAA-type ATPase n=1 Tax=Aspergillus flavus (strain ATCC 200026 / FGSC A1120 / IAM 13836 / NRRL 3357 / JCM 12722 / SRRC 167) TaxID=332952 RepID=A0A7U2MWY8_ASPFN|nr:hypothetical protein AFLA_007616 [Aspergillus flavus NRRL3357]QRD91335.1 putative bcs1 AAA-type ATPase [Aspergillus flavus]RAQ61744.1 bcs1 AAA-type ATPase [Aspergillus flavus]RAQ63310.1 bcs1 AAA-type ATPase [Aspergillus flavus]
MSSPTLTSDQLPVEALLESFIPGYKFFTHLCAYYFRIDISSYLLVFAAGVALWTYSVKTFWAWSQRFLRERAALREIKSQSNLYNYAIRWIAHNDWFTGARKAVAETKMNFPWDDESDDDDIYEADRTSFDIDPSTPWPKIRFHQMRPIRNTPVPSCFHFFIYKGCWMFLYRQPTGSSDSFAAASMETLKLYAAPWNNPVLDTLLMDMQQAALDQDACRVNIRRGLKLGYGFGWAHIASKKSRALSTVILSREKKKSIVEDIHAFLHPVTRRYYEERGIPYRRGYLLHGLPGTGKSTLCFVLAGLLGLDIYMVSLCAKDLDDDSLTLLFQDLPKRCIVVFEDVDQAGLPKRKIGNSMRKTGEDAEHSRQDSAIEANNDKRPSNGITLSGFLNNIDGLTANDGRILIMTTNAIEDLDDALLRPGRIDLKIEFGYADSLALEQWFLLIFMKPAEGPVMGNRDSCGRIRPCSLPAHPDWTSDYIAHLSTLFAENLPPGRFTAAEVQDFLLKYRSRPVEAVNNAPQWADKPQAPFDVDFATPLSTFRIADRPDLYAIQGRVCSIRVSAVLLSCPRTEDGRTGETIEPRVLLLQRPSNGSKEGYYDPGPGGCVKIGDATLQEALKREVMESTGLHFSKIAHSLSVKQWSQSTHSEQREWIEFQYIVNVPESRDDIFPADRGRASGRTSLTECVAKEREDIEWATEAEIRADKYKLHGDHKNILLEAFEKERRATK